MHLQHHLQSVAQFWFYFQSGHLEFNNNTDHFDFEANTRRSLRPKFDANGVEDAGLLFIYFPTRRLGSRYNEPLQNNASK